MRQSNDTVSIWQFSDLKVLKAPAAESPASPVDSNVLFADDFSTFDPGWGSKTNLELRDHKMICSPPANLEMDQHYRGSLFDDVEIRVSIKQSQGSPESNGGIVFWCADYDDFYAAVITSSGYFAVQRIANNKTLIPVPCSSRTSLTRA